METFGERLINFRRKLGYSQVEFADKMAIKSQALLRYEKNIIKPSFDFINKLTLLFPQDIQYLLSGEYKKILTENNFNLSQQQIEILQAFDELDSDEKEIFFYELKAAAAKARKRAKEVHS
ncbi:MAG: helix-turn-helix transcriptional regulator [Arcobacteraceae bacterium]|jgi:transcriptional regulator with XRE-family HTH domain|nr:helix-turn-helix transcriptional regulator [Arcobacteraceae bacterium]